MSLACLIAVAWLALAAPASGEPAEGVSLDSLLREMVDRDAVTRWSSPAFRTAQASSHDRASTSPDDPNTWFANNDWNQFVRVETNGGRREYVLMDQAGPGAVVRFWATWNDAGRAFGPGTLRVYLDGEDAPAIEGSLQKLLDGGGLVGEPLGHGVSPQTPYGQRGHNLYLPIPYARRCKITYEHPEPLEPRTGAQSLYYQIVYRTYDAETPVRTFTTGQLAAAGDLVASVQRRLADSGLGDVELYGGASAGKSLAPGESTTLEHGSGPATIRRLHLRLAADDLPQALRSVVLKMTFDGEQTVWVPAGDFFGVGYEPKDQQTWYTRATAGGDLTAWWVMPFEKDCLIVVENLGDRPVSVAVETDRGAYNWTDRSMHFGATWHQLTDVETQTNAPADHGAFDHNFVTIKGKGVYVGDALTLFDNAAAWWGEGDEKIYVDGEVFPSTFGTGTEDYYGYAWCRPEPFANAFHAQPTGDGNLSRGVSVNARYRLLDGIPFTESLRFDMEIWHWAKTTMNYAPTTFFYVRPGATTNVRPDPASAALKVKRTPEPFRVAGATEGEAMRVAAHTGGTVQVQPDSGWGFSGEKQLWWRDGKVGDALTLRFDVPQAGRYQLAAGLTKARDYGVVRLALNGQPLGRFDGYRPDGVSVAALELGAIDLPAGEQTLVVEVVGADPAAAPGRMFGLDYLKLTRVEP